MTFSGDFTSWVLYLLGTTDCEGCVRNYTESQRLKPHDDHDKENPGRKDNSTARIGASTKGT
jgi:hypothetical protein